MATRGLHGVKIRFIGNAMSTTDNQDETAGFVTSSSDMPEVQPEPQEEHQHEGQAKPDTGATEGEGGQADGEAEQAEKQDDTGNDSDAAAQDKGKKPNRVQKRIDQVVREREEARREKEALEKRLADLEKAQSEKSSVKDEEPKESDFDTYDEYLDALDAYDNRDQSDDKESDKAKEDKPDKDEESQAEELTDSQKTAMAVIRESVEAAEKPQDFESVARNPEVPITGEMLEALAECDDPAKIMYHLGQNKDLASEIASGSAAQQMRGIAKLDLTVTSKPPKPAKITNAPDPISPVAGSDAQQKSPAEMSQAEYEAWANKQERKRQSW